MIPYSKEKVENAINFFATEHRKKTKEYLFQTFLYKYLAYLEYEMLKKTGKPSLGLTFRAMERGPVPIEIYDKRDKLDTELFKFAKTGETQYQIIPKGEPDLDYFSKNEIKEMHRLIEIFAQSYIKTNLISEASHKDIKAWKKTFKKKPNAIIDNSLTFSENLFQKEDNELTFAEENYILYNALEKNLNEGRNSSKME